VNTIIVPSNTGILSRTVTHVGQSLRKTRALPYKDIFEAIQKGDLDAVRYFVENQNVDVNSRAPGNSGTAVGSAVGAGHQKIVEYLVSKGKQYGLQRNEHNYFYGTDNQIYTMG